MLEEAACVLELQPHGASLPSTRSPSSGTQIQSWNFVLEDWGGRILYVFEIGSKKEIYVCIIIANTNYIK